jgi:hypothetical protein
MILRVLLSEIKFFGHKVVTISLSVAGGLLFKILDTTFSKQ